jgi:hypothetical protein
LLRYSARARGALCRGYAAARCDTQHHHGWHHPFTHFITSFARAENGSAGARTAPNDHEPSPKFLIRAKDSVELL